MFEVAQNQDFRRDKSLPVQHPRPMLVRQREATTIKIIIKKIKGKGCAGSWFMLAADSTKVSHVTVCTDVVVMPCAIQGVEDHPPYLGA